MFTVEKWFKNALNEVNSTGNSQDIHIDEFIGKKYKNLNNSEIFHYCISVIGSISNYISHNKIDIGDVELLLSIELVSESNLFSGKPKNLEAIEEMFEQHSVPEIILYKEVPSKAYPLNEFYRLPLNLPKYKIGKQIQVLYKEYRNHEDVLNNDLYTRELSLMHMP